MPDQETPYLTGRISPQILEAVEELGKITVRDKENGKLYSIEKLSQDEKST